MMTYKIVQATTMADLVDKINNNIQAGFIPLGGVSHAIFASNASVYSQAMTYNKDKQ